ncbi:hypothetical protein MMC20_006211 [Loxospora ochrophaea]|nr:hypothetical protein [Loxospora ochrophaea]
MFSNILILTSLLSASVLATPKVESAKYQPAAFTTRSPDEVTSNVVSLTRLPGPSLSHAYVRAMMGVTPITPVEMSQVFLAGISFGTETVQAVIDTGSSDTWLAETGFQCVNVTTDADLPEADCYFGPLYNISSTFIQIPDENFNISYADGEFLTGIVGHEKVTVANITVPSQEVGVVDYAAWFGDGVSSGLMGLAFPILTSAYSGDNPTLDSSATQDEYNPIFTSMYTEGLVAPMFSLAISRGNITGGLLAFGGLAPVPASPILASAPFQILQMSGFSGGSPGFSPYQFYTIFIDGYTYAGRTVPPFSEGNGTIETIVDSGTTLIYAPTIVADEINSLFDPPAVYSDYYGAYSVDCSAKVPRFGVKINGTVFHINAEDMILDAGDGTCITGVDDGGTGLFILGDVFLKNVLAVFDVGASEMRFAAREFY